MFTFAMDCLFAGVALCLLLGGTKELLTNNHRDHKDFIWLSAAFGLAMFFMSRFIMSFFILWSMWD